MRQRVISALVGLLILAVVLVFFDTFVFNVVIAAISLIALFEMLRATGCIKSKSLMVLSFSIAIAMPFVRANLMRENLELILFLMFLLFFILLIKRSQTIRVELAAMSFMFGIFIPLFFSCAVFIRDTNSYIEGLFYVFLALACAWLSDTCAYFTGRKFGRHKLAPVVSPKKTVEGAIGGLLGCVAIMLIIAAAFSLIMNKTGNPVSISYIKLAFVTSVGSVLGMIGDLSASVIKRQFNVKDFGTIMPGHGGVLDRFDSVMFTLPAIFILSGYIRIITR